MCGIIAAFDKRAKAEDVNEIIVNQYEEQYSRGQEGFGGIFIKKNGEYAVTRATEPVKALLDLYANPSKMIIFHHRTPTSSDNHLDQTHPILVSDGSLKHDYLVVHNGVVSNSDELKKIHEESGMRYRTAYTNGKGIVEYNDTESIAIELAKFIEGGTEEIGTSSSAAFIAAQIDKKTNKIIQIFFGRSSFAVLNVHSSPGRIEISSEGKGAEVETDKLWSFSLDNLKLKSQPLCFKAYAYTGYTAEDHDYIGLESKEPHYSDSRTWASKDDDDEEDPTVRITERLEDEVLLHEDELTGIIDEFLDELKDSDKVWLSEPKKVAREVFETAIKIKKLCEQAVSDEWLLISNENEEKAKTKTKETPYAAV